MACSSSSSLPTVDRWVVGLSGAGCWPPGWMPRGLASIHTSVCITLYFLQGAELAAARTDAQHARAEAAAARQEAETTAAQVGGTR